MAPTKMKQVVNEMGYTMEPTAAGSSSQNWLVERPNRTIAEILRAMLARSGLSDEYWSDSLIHAIWIKKRLPHSNFNFKSTPFTEFTGKRPNLSKIKVFGCPVTVEKITTRRTKLSDNTNEGLFLRFANTF